ncbi:MAG TPA: SusD/RagB family nutrient-binding outer membrane lipoprotein [Bacteroidales bacterium]|nr:SusD/RagB family nutrient-binding outer membrane lipoprotein [Bacteroidales bacterium]
MKKILSLMLISVMLFSCSEDLMDEINQDRNNALNMQSKNLIPDLLLKSAFESTATDIAWYATVYVEHNAGTWNQSHQADRRIAQNASSLLNNSWNAIYDVMNIAKTIINKTDPATGDEPTEYWPRGIAQIMMAYNLAIATDGWGEVPYTEAFQGLENVYPKYDKQSTLYPKIMALLDSAISNLNKATVFYRDKDYIYGSLSNANNKAAWIKTANALKARFALRLTKVNGNAAATAALAAIPNAYASAADAMLLKGFAVALPGSNPWGEFWYWRDHLSVSTTIFDLMNTRNDPRMADYFSSTDPADIAPIGAAEQVQGGYSQSLFTSGYDAMASPILLFTYHELKFIEAEAKFRTGDATWKDALKAAVEASFAFVGTAGGDTYFNTEVDPRLTAGNELNEILTQKYIAFFDREAIEAYNDYKRTGIPEMKNPNNATVGFIWRFPWALSEISSNSANVPKWTIFDKTWWAGGTE